MVALGIVLFALSIGVSVMLHEAGHMYTAKAFGMKVTRFFIGFGPTLWSFHRGETEYGLKPIPAGGFCAIEGMSSLEDAPTLAPDEAHRAFWRAPLWKRTVVLGAGSMTHFILAVVLIYVCALFVGLPNPAYAAAVNRASAHPLQQPAYVSAVQQCLPAYPATIPTQQPCTAQAPRSPAAQAGLRAGDRIVGIAGTTVSTWGDLTARTAGLADRTVPLVWTRDGTRHTASVTIHRVRHVTGGTAAAPTVADTPLLGVNLGIAPIPLTVTYGPLRGAGATASLTGELFTGTFVAIGRVPSLVPDLLRSFTGHQRNPNGVISVVGASRIGGDVFAHGGAAGIASFLLLLASLNVFIGIFNLFPLLPLDGGHIAVNWYEKLRFWWAARRARPSPGFVDPQRLVPATLAFIVIFGAFGVLVILADILNPVKFPN